MTERHQQAEHFARRLPFFEGLAEADIQALLGSSPIADYPRHGYLFHQGDAAERFFIIVEGWVKLCRDTPEGEESVIAVMTRGDLFGEAVLFEGSSYPFSAQAAEDCRVIEIRAAHLRAQCAASPALMQRIMQMMSREMHRLQIEREHMAIMSAPQRVGCLLLQLSTGMIGKGGTFAFPYDKSLAAARLGMKPETFSRALAQLQSVGVTVKGAEIAIDSFAGLVDFCCSHCSQETGACAGSQRESCGAAICPGRLIKVSGK